MEIFLKRNALGFWRGVFYIWQRDLCYFWRHPFHFLAVVLFAFILAVIYSYALEREIFSQQFNFDGIMLCTLFFINTLFANQSFYAEAQGRVLRILHMSALDVSSLYTGKLLSHWQRQLIFLLICLPVYFFLLQGRNQILSWEKFGELYLPLFICLSICALSLAALGTLLGAVVEGNRLQSLLLPLILLPSSIPILLLGSQFLRAARHITAFHELSLNYYLILMAPALLYIALGNLLYFYLANDSEVS